MDISHIRNFSIIAHIDHGKSTLADRLLEFTGTVSARDMQEQILDGMELERERGITIKAKAVHMEHEGYVLNLIDTPGHVDFSYEVSRALAASEGCLLVVDASQGVEAQTLANATLARESGLPIIPVINKIDLPAADPEACGRQLVEILGIEAEPILVSAKDGTGVPGVVNAIINRIPAPKGSVERPLSALVFDSVFDPYRGVIVFVRVMDGILRSGMEVLFMARGDICKVDELGHLKLKYVPGTQLSSGDVGYAICGIKDIKQVKIGDTITNTKQPCAKPLPGYRDVKPYVFAGFYPINTGDYESLRSAMEKLHLSDSAFVYEPDRSEALGFGFRCGFLGLLHMDVVKERLEREFSQNIMITAPSVAYKVHVKGGQEFIVDNPAHFPPHGTITLVEEPFVMATIVTPAEYMGALMQLSQDTRGKFIEMRYITPVRVVLRYELPLVEIVVNFYDNVKSLSKGYASFDYEPACMKAGDLTKLEILVAGDPVDALSTIVHKSNAYERARDLAERLKNLIPRQQFEVPIQARIENHIIARETIPSIKKDVLAKCYGGDITRKRKLLEKQKEGKKRMKQFGRVEVPQEAFFAVLETSKVKKGK